MRESGGGRGATNDGKSLLSSFVALAVYSSVLSSELAPGSVWMLASSSMGVVVIVGFVAGEPKLNLLTTSTAELEEALGVVAVPAPAPAAVVVVAVLLELLVGDGRGFSTNSIPSVEAATLSLRAPFAWEGVGGLVLASEGPDLGEVAAGYWPEPKPVLPRRRLP